MRSNFFIYLLSFFVSCLVIALFTFVYFTVFPCRGIRKTISVNPQMNFEVEALEKRLREHVQIFAGKIGERNLFAQQKLYEASTIIRDFWEKEGFKVFTHTYAVNGIPSENLWIQMDGTDLPGEIVLIGTHYDSVIGSPGANDNASGVGALLEISKAFRERNPPRRSLRFVAFVNEEPPFFMTNQMGSRVYAREVAKKKEKIVAMISLETIGYYTDEPRSQKYPPFLGWFYPHRGNFVGVVGNISSQHLVKKVVQYFKAAVDFSCECLAAPRILLGVDWSDHASFWDHGYPAVMVTDTALYRYPHYHQRTDVPDHLNYPAYAKVVYGLTQVIERLANE